MKGGQIEGPGGLIVDRMIRRSVRKAFRGVWWLPPAQPFPRPCIVVVNHHGWHDGYVMFHALTSLELPFLLWMEELGAFPLFGKAGAMPYPVASPSSVRSRSARRSAP
jgi:1-acyl-sn-glycerol-3-phosphate acyltransferase